MADLAAQPPRIRTEAVPIRAAPLLLAAAALAWAQPAADSKPATSNGANVADPSSHTSMGPRSRTRQNDGTACRRAEIMARADAVPGSKQRRSALALELLLT
jgi:hypothetical protein